MNLYTLTIERDGTDETRTSSNRLELINLARMAYPCNARVENCYGRIIFIQSATHSKERD